MFSSNTTFRRVFTITEFSRLVGREMNTKSKTHLFTSSQHKINENGLEKRKCQNIRKKKVLTYMVGKKIKEELHMEAK